MQKSSVAIDILESLGVGIGWLRLVSPPLFYLTDVDWSPWNSIWIWLPVARQPNFDVRLSFSRVIQVPSSCVTKTGVQLCSTGSWPISLIQNISISFMLISSICKLHILMFLNNSSSQWIISNVAMLQIVDEQVEKLVKRQRKNFYWGIW